MKLGRWTRSERRVRRFIVEELLEEPFHGKDPLAEGAVDSLALEQLVEFAETDFGMSFTDEDMIEENFESISALVALIESKRRYPASARN